MIATLVFIFLFASTPSYAEMMEHMEDMGQDAGSPKSITMSIAKMTCYRCGEMSKKFG